MKKVGRKNCAVSEVFGTILLLLISVSLFSAVYLTLFSVDVKTEAPTVDIVGSVKSNYLIVEHRGGKPLSLDTKIMINFDGSTFQTIKLDEGNFLNNNSKSNGKWDIGESFKFPLASLTNFSRFNPVDVMVVDPHSNSVIMTGEIEEARTADIKIDIDVSDIEPEIEDEIEIYLKVYNNGPSDTENLTINYLLSGSLEHKSNTTTKGVYDEGIGIWYVGELFVGQYAYLNITAEVISFGYSLEFTQIGIILDGSGSINESSWELTIEGLAEAISDGDIFPHDGTVELTVIRFGVGNQNKCSRLEVGPIVVRTYNYELIADEIEGMPYSQGWTPTATGISLTSDMIAGSSNFGGFNPNNIQILTFVTDGNANIYSEPGKICRSGKANIPKGQDAAYEAKEYMRERLHMNEEQDEFDIIAVDPGQGHVPIDEDWLKDMCYPQPPWDTWPPDGPGWYRHVQNWQEFKDSLKEHFDVLFRKVNNRVEIIGSSYMDPNSKNDWDMVTIYPQKAQT